MRSRISAPVSSAPIVRDGARPAGRHLAEHAHRRAELARRAVAALERVVLDERLLQRVQIVPVGQTFDGDDLGPLERDGQRQARVGAAAVDQHRAGTALAVRAAVLGAGQVEVLAQEVEQRRAGVDRDVVRDAVHPQLHVGDDRGVHGFGHASSFPRRPTSNPHRVVPEMFTSIGPGHALSVRIRSPGRVRRTRWRLACPPEFAWPRAAHPGTRSQGALMRALVYHGKRDVRVDTVPDPTIEEPTDAIVRITSTGICGSDLHLYEVLGAVPRRGRHPRPRADGHRRGGRRRGRAHRSRATAS